MERAHRRGLYIREVDITCLNWSLSLQLIKHRDRACCRFLLSSNMTDTGTNPPQYLKLINTNKVWEMSVQLRIILQYAAESCSSSFKKKKKSGYNFMNLWQINRQGSQCVAQWTFHVSGSQGRCLWESVCVCVSGISQSHTGKLSQTRLKITVFLFL